MEGSFMTIPHADIVICGAGIAGIAAAYQLIQQHDIRNIVLVDEREPLTLTSDKSTEAYRNWWPGPGTAMVDLMNRSIDLLEELAAKSNNYFNMNRRGYLFLTGDPQRAAAMKRNAAGVAALGAGELRLHTTPESNYRPSAAEGFDPDLNGADFLEDPALIRRHYPFLTNGAVAALHTRRCGWLSAQQLGMYLLEKIRAAGARVLRGRVTGIRRRGGRVSGVEVVREDGELHIETGVFVNAAGPLIDDVARLLDVSLPVFNELHGKVAFEDTRGVIPRGAPLVIWNDPVELLWSDAERAELGEIEELGHLLDPFPAGVHFRPEGAAGAQTVLAIWTYDIHVQDATWPVSFDEEYAELVLRGMARVVPGLQEYVGRIGRPWIDGGYYCKTKENRPLVGPLPGVDGAYLIGALSGYGIMASLAAGELLAAHAAAASLPPYASAFTLARYDDPGYRLLLEQWDPNAGQL
jgi:glycine/D-amino acid oxidase-like deaminating enzyme